jgi:predicted ATPase/class 3 adenylate cyclase/DNA-binding CsgD family transcriptional regulator/uncharacterized protein HemY
MAEPRTRTVTFLLTDVEGSTALWETDPAAMRQALAHHDALIETSIVEHGGLVVKSRGEGDSVFAVFGGARDAIGAASALQVAFQTVAWPTPAPLRVRMAVDTGEAQVRDGNYFGPVVNRCARLRAAAHGGQILLSQATTDLVRDVLPEGVDLRALGEHRLSDLARPTPVFQVVHAALPAEFPALKSLAAPPSTLPRELTSFVGREREVAEVKRLLGLTRLLTLTGSGGVGKTRLGLRVASDVADRPADAEPAYPDGVWLVELAALGDGALVPQALASALDVRDQPGRILLDTLVDVLRPRTCLVLLDNCEHLVAACAALADRLLRSCPGLSLLATSREPLGIAGETVWRVPPLTLPDALPGELPAGGTAALAQFEAVRLFEERARAALPAFTLTDQNGPAVAQICQRLDGIPLAIELAAARARGLAPEQLAGRLDDRFRLLTGGSRTALARHQTLRALVDWSHELLSEPERVLFRRLSVFAGGWTLDAAEAVCSGQEIEPEDVLGPLLQLVDRSLVLAEEQLVLASDLPPVRYRLLETLRQYGAEKLREAGEELAVRARHLDWYLRLAEVVGSSLRGRGAADQSKRLEAEHDNLRAALGWSLMAETADETRLSGQQLAGMLLEFWWMRAYLSEGRRWLDAALSLDLKATNVHRYARARALVGAGLLSGLLGDFDRADALNTEALTLLRPEDDPSLAGLAMSVLGFAAEGRGDTDRAAGLYEQVLALARAVQHSWITGWQLANLGRLAIARGDYDRAATLLEESVTQLEQAGDRQGMTWPFQSLGRLAERLGDHARATLFFEEALAAAQDVGDKAGMAWTLGNLGRQARIQGDFALATSWLEESLRLSRDIGDRWCAARSLGNLGRVALARHDHQRAAALFEESLVLSQSVSGRGRRAAYALHYLGVVARELGQPERAGRLMGAADALEDAGGRAVSPLDRVERKRELASIRQTLGDQRFAAAWAAGRAMSLDEAVDYAMTALNGPASVATPGRARSATEHPTSLLSAREFEVVLLVARGLSNRQVAEELVISTRTASTHVTHILNKLGLANRWQIAAWAAEQGLAAQ